MKKLAIWIPLLLVTALTNNMAFAASTEVYVSNSGAGTTCSQAQPCASFANAVSVVTTRGFGGPGEFSTITYLNGVYTATGNASAQISLRDALGTHASAYLVIRGESWGSPKWSTGCVMMQGYSEIEIYSEDYVWVDGFYSKNTTSKGARIDDSSHIKLTRIGFKNCHGWTDNFGSCVEFASENNNSGTGNDPSTTDSLLEDIGMFGVFKYGVIFGGTDGYAEHNIARRVYMRWDGSAPTSNPTGGMVNYGATTGVLGARNNTIQNLIAIDFNPCQSPFYAGGDTCYGASYQPHSATNINTFDSIVLNVGANWRGYMFGEDSASNIALYNSVGWGTGNALLFSANTSSSHTIRGATLHSPAFGDFFNSGTQRIENTNYYRTEKPRTSAENFEDFNAYTSTGKPTGVTNSITLTQNQVYVASITQSQLIGTGLNGANVGAVIIKQRGKSGTLWGEPGWNDLQTTNLWGNGVVERNFRDLAAMNDEGNAATNNGSNTEARGFAADTSSFPVTNYIWTYNGGICPPEICTDNASLPPSEGPGGDTNPGVIPRRFGIDGTMTIRGVSFQ